MKIIFDDLKAYSKVIRKCATTQDDNECGYCPFYELCPQSDCVEDTVFANSEILSIQKNR